MTNIKSKKGITLVSLVITIIVMLILSGTVIYRVSFSNGTEKYNKMAADIKLLNDKVLMYYNKYGEIPKTDRLIKFKIDEINYIKYYEIDLAKLEGLTLNYGNDYGKEEELTENSDVYLINSSLHVYYLKGVEKNGETQHYIEKNENYVASDITPEYTELEYIESTGTQFIDTGFIPNSNTAIEMKASSLSTTTFALYCARGASTTDKTYSAFLLNGNNLRVDYYNATNSISTTVSNDVAYIYTQDKNLIYVNGELKKTLNLNEFSCERTMNLLAVDASTHRGNAKLYYCKIWDNGTLVRDFIPCKDANGVVCLYEKVEGKYYYNKGTGDFVAGPEIVEDEVVDTPQEKYTELEYIESTGTQYIDTGVKFKLISKMDISLSVSSFNRTAKAGVFGSYSSNAFYQLYASGTSNEYFTASFGSNTYKSVEKINLNEKYDIHIENGSIRINNNSYNLDAGINESEIPMYLFYRNDTGAKSQIKLYACKIYDGDIIIRDYIPVKDKNGIVCLYEKVEGKYYYNQGTGDFVAGPEV